MTECPQEVDDCTLGTEPHMHMTNGDVWRKSVIGLKQVTVSLWDLHFLANAANAYYHSQRVASHLFGLGLEEEPEFQWGKEALSRVAQLHNIETDE